MWVWFSLIIVSIRGGLVPIEGLFLSPKRHNIVQRFSATCVLLTRLLNQLTNSTTLKIQL